MSSFTVTIVVPTAETESAFLMHVVQAALKAYRNHRNAGFPREWQRRGPCHE